VKTVHLRSRTQQWSRRFTRAYLASSRFLAFGKTSGLTILHHEGQSRRARRTSLNRAMLLSRSRKFAVFTNVAWKLTESKGSKWVVTSPQFALCRLESWANAIARLCFGWSAPCDLFAKGRFMSFKIIVLRVAAPTQQAKEACRGAPARRTCHPPPK
jgi:hypothetical protein